MVCTLVQSFCRRLRCLPEIGQKTKGTKSHLCGSKGGVKNLGSKGISGRVFLYFTEHRRSTFLGIEKEGGGGGGGRGRRGRGGGGREKRRRRGGRRGGGEKEEEMRREGEEDEKGEEEEMRRERRRRRRRERR